MRGFRLVLFLLFEGFKPDGFCLFQTRREYVPVGSEKTSMFFTVWNRQKPSGLKARTALLLLCTFLVFPPAFAAQPLTVLLDWYPNPDHAPLFVAEEQGFFQQHGLNVKLVSPTDPGDPLKLVAAGKADIAITYQPTLLMAVDNDIPVVRIGTLIATPLNAAAVLDNSNIKTIADFKGKKIGYSMGGTDHAMLESMLATAGLTDKDVTLIDVHYGLAQALMSGQVDVITGIMRNFEPFEMADNGKPVRVFNCEDYGIPLYDELIFVTRKSAVNDARLPLFLAALTQATNYLINHPQATWQAFAKAYPELNNNLNRQAWFATLPRFALRPAALDSSRYENFAHYWQKQGIISHVPLLTDYVVELRY